jgi:hypothetical protein
VRFGNVAGAMLLLLTSLTTAYTTFYNMMWAIWGGHVSPLLYIAMLGSLLLLVASLVRFWNSSWVVLWLTFVALLLLWLYYLPAAAYTPWTLIGSVGIQGVLAVCSILLLLFSTLYWLRWCLQWRRQLKIARH